MKLLREKGAISMPNHVLFISETIPLVLLLNKKRDAQ